jgi:hypothetical protein
MNAPHQHARSAGSRSSRRLGSALACCLLLACAGCNLAYATRVIAHGDSHTDDYTWKRSTRLAPAVTPVTRLQYRHRRTFG